MGALGQITTYLPHRPPSVNLLLSVLWVGLSLSITSAVAGSSPCGFEDYKIPFNNHQETMVVGEGSLTLTGPGKLHGKPEATPHQSWVERTRAWSSVFIGVDCWALEVFILGSGSYGFEASLLLVNLIGI